MSQPTTFLCLTCDFKGESFLRALHAAGNRIYLVTSTEHQQDAWPFEVLEDVFYLDKNANGHWNADHLIGGVAHMMRGIKIDRVVALDDFDVEKAALVRETFRIPGMGQTTVRHFRDKLAMRMKAAEAGIPVPAFCGLFNDETINEFADTVAAPWIVKPRSEASATGLKKVHSKEELWQVIHSLGDHRHEYLVEQFKPGAVYHADALTVDGKVKFCRVSKYMNTPFEVAHGGGIFRTHTIDFNAKETKALEKMNAQIMKAFGLQFSATHTEFIQAEEDGQFYFLETASRVGGAHIAEMVEAASGISLWEEWAKIESASANNESYKLPKIKKEHAGIVVSLSRFEHPDTSSFQDQEIVWRMNKQHHIGLIVQNKKTNRIVELLDQYALRIRDEFHASAPAKEVVH